MKTNEITKTNEKNWNVNEKIYIYINIYKKFPYVLQEM